MGPAPANILPYVRTPDNFTIDKMHGCDLGIGKDIAKLLFDSSNQNEDYYLKPLQLPLRLYAKMCPIITVEYLFAADADCREASCSRHTGISHRSSFQNELFAVKV